MARVDEGDGVERRVARHPDQAIPDLQRYLKLRNHAVSGVHIATNQVLQPVVAVEPAAPLSELYEPWPDVTGGPIDRHGVGPYELWAVDQTVAWPRGAQFSLSRAPARDRTSQWHDRRRRKRHEPDHHRPGDSPEHTRRAFHPGETVPEPLDRVITHQISLPHHTESRARMTPVPARARDQLTHDGEEPPRPIGHHLCPLAVAIEHRREEALCARNLRTAIATRALSQGPIFSSDPQTPDRDRHRRWGRVGPRLYPGGTR